MGYTHPIPYHCHFLREEVAWAASDITELKQLENVQLQQSLDPASSQQASLQGGGMCNACWWQLADVFEILFGAQWKHWLKSKTLTLLGFLFTVDSFPDFWSLFILEHFSLHLSSKQHIHNLKRAHIIDRKSSLWNGGSGYQGGKGTYCLGQWHWDDHFPSLSHLLQQSFSPLPRGFCPTVDFGGLQISQCGATFSFCGLFLQRKRQ